VAKPRSPGLHHCDRVSPGLFTVSCLRSGQGPEICIAQMTRVQQDVGRCTAAVDGAPMGGIVVSYSVKNLYKQSRRHDNSRVTASGPRIRSKIHLAEASTESGTSVLPPQILSRLSMLSWPEAREGMGTHTYPSKVVSGQ
jgi:hypothetical protein